MAYSCPRLFLFGMALCIAGAVRAAPAAVEVVSAEFGVFDARPEQQTVFEATRVVPHRSGQRYGWVIELATKKRSVSVREEYVLPLPASAPKVPEAAEWLADSVTIPLQRRNQVSQRQLVPVDGRIYGEWEVAPGEPPGHRHLQVVIEGEVAASFEYDVK